MKKYIFLTVLLFTLSAVKAQDLTRDQTIAYLLEKFKETEDLKKTYDSKYTFTLTDLVFKKTPDRPKRITYSYRRNFSDNTKDRAVRIFDPQYITKVEKLAGTAGDAVGYIQVSFTGRNVIGEFTDTEGDYTVTALTSILFPYLLADPLHAERLMKAFLHLKDVTLRDMPADPFME